MMTRWIASIALLGLAAGCADLPTAPMPARSVQIPFTLKLSAAQGSPADPVVATGTATNTGTTTLAFPDGCASNTGVFFDVLDQEGQPVHVTDPTAPPPMCPVGLAAMSPGQAVTGSITFNGTLYRSTGGRYAAPPGTYTIVAHFWLYEGHDWSSPNQVLDARASFAWSQ